MKSTRKPSKTTKKPTAKPSPPTGPTTPPGGSETTDTPEEGVRKDPKAPKTVYLKQYLVTASADPSDADAPKRAAFVLATCAQNARKDWEARTGMKIVSCMQSAESGLTKEDSLSRDLWAEGLNREEEVAKRVVTESAKRYFELKDRAERVQAAKRRLGIGDWETATEEQLAELDRILSGKP